MFCPHDTVTTDLLEEGALLLELWFCILPKLETLLDALSGSLYWLPNALCLPNLWSEKSRLLPPPPPPP